VLAQLRQLRQVALHLKLTGGQDDAQEGLMLERMRTLIERGLGAVSDDDMVKQRAILSPFHAEVHQLLEELGANLRIRVVDVFIIVSRVWAVYTCLSAAYVAPAVAYVWTTHPTGCDGVAGAQWGGATACPALARAITIHGTSDLRHPT
jgi:hypothetical protein